MSSNLPTVNQGGGPPPTEYQEGGVPQAWPGWAGEQQQEGGVPWGRYFSALRRYKWLILLMLAVGVAVGAILPRFLIKPSYEAKATVWIQQEQAVGVASVGSTVGNTPNAWVELLTSRSVISNIVRKRQLYLSLDRAADSLLFTTFQPGVRLRPGYYKLIVNANGTEYTLNTITDEPIERGAVGDTVGRSLGFKWSPPAGLLRGGEVVSFRLTAPEMAAQALAGQLRAVLPQYSNTLRLSLTARNPHQAASTLNELQREFVAMAQELKRRKYVEIVKNLEGQMRAAEDELQRKQSAWENHQSRIVTGSGSLPITPGSPQTTDLVTKDLFEKKLRSEQLRQDRTTLERLIAQMPADGYSADVWLMLTTVQSGARDLRAGIEALLDKEKELRTARAQYTEEHPTVQQLVGDVTLLRTRTVPALARQWASLLGAEERRINDQARVSETVSEGPSSPILPLRTCRIWGILVLRALLWRPRQSAR